MKPILKYQEGGDISSLFINYQPFTGLNKQATSPQATTAVPTSQNDGESKSSSKVGLKDLLGLVKELKGLPVDQNIVTQQIQKMYDDASLFSSNGELSTGDLISTYLSALRSIRMAEFNQQEYKDVREQVVKEGGYNEIAIDTQGKIYIQNQKSGAIDRITPEQYNGIKDKENYQVLTNANLLYYRANNPDFAFNSDIFSIVSNGIGMGKITDYLQKVASKIGTTTLKQEGYSEKSANGIVSGLANLEQAFQAGMTIEGLYKQGKLTKDQTDQAKLALNYLWKTLPDNAKTLLKVKGGSIEGAFNLIQTLVFSGIDNTIELSNGLVKNPDGSDSGSGSGNSSNGGDAKGKEMDPATGFILGMGHSQEIILNPGTSYQYKVQGRFAPITDHAGNILGQYSTLQDVTSSSFAGILDFNNATFGGARIESFNRAFLENGDAVSVDLPIDIQYLNRTGIIRPDFTLLGKIEQLNVAYKSGEVDPNNMEQVNRKCEELQLPPMYSKLNESGIPELDQSRYARFAKINILADENAFAEGQTPSLGLVGEVSSKRRDTFKEYMKTKDKNYSLDEDFLFFGGGDDLYEGSVYIPIRRDIIAASYGGKYYKLPQINAIQAAQQFSDDQRVQRYKTSPRYSELK